MPKFEIAIYNERVAAAVAEGRRYARLDDSWGDTRYIEIQARDILDARQKINARYPPESGYVIQAVEALD